MTFNRTIVELKQCQPSRRFYDAQTFNRTIVELKHDVQPLETRKFHDAQTFNRTIVELKPSISMRWQQP